MTSLTDAGFEPIAAPSAPGSRRFHVGPTSRLFDGHFDGAPILPGVAHIALAIEVGREGRAPGDRCLGVRDVRFLHPVGPGDTIDVICTPAADAGSVRFEIHGRGGTTTTGVLLFGAGDDGVF